MSPNLSSPTIGWPIELKWFLIWCFLPVTGDAITKENPLKNFNNSKLVVEEIFLSLIKIGVLIFPLDLFKLPLTSNKYFF